MPLLALKSGERSEQVLSVLYVKDGIPAMGFGVVRRRQPDCEISLVVELRGIKFVGGSGPYR